MFVKAREENRIVDKPEITTSVERQNRTKCLLKNYEISRFSNSGIMHYWY